MHGALFGVPTLRPRPRPRPWRQVKAIESEFQQAKQGDSARAAQLLWHLCDEQHPYHRHMPAPRREDEGRLPLGRLHVVHLDAWPPQQLIHRHHRLQE